jgi:hypothetical protein
MRTGVFLRWVAHPLTVGAAAVLLLNDHVFKQAWPGLVTGKLSDVAGLVVAPPAIGLLLGLFLAGRIGAAAAVLLTGAGFTLVKLTAVGAEAASAAWSMANGPSVILADPSDLVALPALGLAWWVWCRVAAAPPLPDGWAVRSRVVVAVPFAVLAITATSAPPRLPSVDSVRIECCKGKTREHVVIEVGGRLYSSLSGVDDWTLLANTPHYGPLPERRQIEACVPQDAAHCYRGRGGAVDPDEPLPRDGRLLGVDETTDAGRTWHTAWEIPAGRWPFVWGQHPFPGGLDRADQVASVAVLVRAVPGGHEVIVANGLEGLAVRGVDGAWRRVPVVDTVTGLDIRPVPLTGFGRAIGDDVISAGLITLLALLIGMSVAAGRARARLGYGLNAVFPLGLFVVLALPISGMWAFITGSSGASTGPWLVLALCLVGTGIGLTLAQQVLRRWRMAVVAAAAVLTGLAFVAPALGWTMGHPQDREPATALGLILAAGCLLVVAAAGWWAGRDPIPRPAPEVWGWPAYPPEPPPSRR